MSIVEDLKRFTQLIGLSSDSSIERSPLTRQAETRANPYEQVPKRELRLDVAGLEIAKSLVGMRESAKSHEEAGIAMAWNSNVIGMAAGVEIYAGMQEKQQVEKNAVMAMSGGDFGAALRTEETISTAYMDAMISDKEMQKIEDNANNNRAVTDDMFQEIEDFANAHTSEELEAEDVKLSLAEISKRAISLAGNGVNSGHYGPDNIQG